MFVYGDTCSTKNIKDANGILYIFDFNMEGVERVGSEYSLNGCRADSDRARRREFDFPLASTNPEGRAAKHRGSSDKIVSSSLDSEFGFGAFASTKKQGSAFGTPLFFACRLNSQNFNSAGIAGLRSLI